MKVYPVQLTPLVGDQRFSCFAPSDPTTQDWFQGLSTSFKLEDLTENPEMIRGQISAKSQQLDTLNSQLVALSMGTRGDPAELRAKVETAQDSLDSAQSALAQQYTSNVIELAKTCLDVCSRRFSSLELRA